MDGREFGASRRRREDAALLTGAATFTDDCSPPGVAHAAILRSRYGHARIEAIDTSRAEAVDGVLGVYVGADVQTSKAPGVVRVEGPIPGQVVTEYEVLATDRVRFVGEGVAVVVAEDRYTANDALNLVDVEYDRLDGVTDVREAVGEGSPTLHKAAPDNVAFEWPFGDAEAADAAFDEADHVVEVSLTNQRLIGVPMEPRAVLAEFDPSTGLSVTMSSQSPHRAKAFLAETLGLPEEHVRVVSPWVGGGFGVKGPAYPEEVVMSWCAMELVRPVKWTSTRSESNAADRQSRDSHVEGAAAVDADGKIRGLRATAHVAIGAYYTFAPSLARNFKLLLSGQYAIPAIHGRAIGTFSNTAPIGPYRGAGRPETFFFLERLVDEVAHELGLDPADVRRRNQIPPDAFPYETPVGATYDSGDYGRALDLALSHVDYGALRERQAALRGEDRYLGVGLACFIENTGTGPGLGETARVRVDASGGVTAFLGTHDHGQGHGTTFAQLLADEFELPYDDVEVREGDTDDLPSGVGTFGSRSAPVGASAMIEAAREVRERARRVAARQLEVATDDLEYEAGVYSVTGAPDQSVHVGELAALAGGDGGLEATVTYDPPDYAYAFGSHVAVVEVDPDTGEIDVLRYVAVDDCGRIINPVIAEGQVHGAVVQGLAQALTEAAVYDETGTLLTASLQDYALLRASDVPEIETHHTVTPCPHNPLGVKGIGEGGTTAATPAVVNAVVDALRPFGVSDLEMPLTPETVWRAIHGSGRGPATGSNTS